MAKPGLGGKSLIFFLLGSGLIWLPAINQLADTSRPPDTTMVATSALANLGLLALIGLNVWVHRRRQR